MQTHLRGLLKLDDRPDALALMHQIERLVDRFQGHAMRNEFVDKQFLVQIPLHQFRHTIHTLPATERRSLPRASGHQLEWPRADFRSRSSDAHNDRYTPALGGRFEGSSHRINVAHTLESEIESVVLFDQHLLDWTIAKLLGVDAFRGAECFG